MAMFAAEGAEAGYAALSETSSIGAESMSASSQFGDFNPQVLGPQMNPNKAGYATAAAMFGGQALSGIGGIIQAVTHTPAKEASFYFDYQQKRDKYAVSLGLPSGMSFMNGLPSVERIGSVETVVGTYHATPFRGTVASTMTRTQQPS